MPPTQPPPSSDLNQPTIHPITVTRVTSPQELAVALEIRKEVFIQEQGVSEAEELDGLDNAASTIHLLATTADGEPCGTARILWDDPAGPIENIHIGRVAVRAPYRSYGVGSALMQQARELIVSLLPHNRRGKIQLSAQEHALEFYSRLGYTVTGPRYLDAGIWHRDAHLIVGD